MSSRRFWVAFSASFALVVTFAWVVQSKRDLRNEMNDQIRRAERYAASALASWESACAAAADQVMKAQTLKEQLLVASVVEHCLYGHAFRQHDLLRSDDIGGLVADLERAIQGHRIPTMFWADDQATHPLPHGYQRE